MASTAEAVAQLQLSPGGATAQAQLEQQQRDGGPFAVSASCCSTSTEKKQAHHTLSFQRVSMLSGCDLCLLIDSQHGQDPMTHDTAIPDNPHMLGCLPACLPAYHVNLTLHLHCFCSLPPRR